MSRPTGVLGILRSCLMMGLAALLMTGVGLPTAHAEDPGPQLLLVLDSSGSMKEPAINGTKMQEAQNALNSMVEGLPATADVGLRIFGATVENAGDEGACSDSQLLVPIGQDNRAEMVAAVGEATPYGETPISYALQEAAKDLGSEGQRSIVLVSDGVATCEPDPCEVASDLAEAGINLTIDVVGLGVDETAREQLQCVATNGNGNYYDAANTDEIVEALDTAAQRTVKPLEYTGTEVDGTQEAVGAPVLTSGNYVDELSPVTDDSRVRYYTVQRTMEASDVVVAALVQPKVGAPEAIHIEMTQGDRHCDSDSDTSNGSTALLTARVVAGQERSSGDCETAEHLLIKVERKISDANGTADVDPLKLQLRVTERPHVSNYWALPEDIEVDVQGDLEVGAGVDVTPGSSMGDAASLASRDTYEGHIMASEVQTFKVSVNWGQRVRAQLIMNQPKASDAEVLANSDTMAWLYLLGPAGSRADAQNVSGLDDGGSVRVSSSPVLYRSWYTSA
ncbi:MAG: vWA domain-containing protein, partial [Arachnia sp.]